MVLLSELEHNRRWAGLWSLGKGRRGNSKSQTSMGTKLTPWQERGAQLSTGNTHMESAVNRCPTMPSRGAQTTLPRAHFHTLCWLRPEPCVQFGARSFPQASKLRSATQALVSLTASDRREGGLSMAVSCNVVCKQGQSRSHR